MGWLVVKNGDAYLNDMQKRDMIYLEEELTADLLAANPYLLSICYQANDRALKIVHDEITGTMELETNLDALETQLCRVHTAYGWLQCVFTDVKALPNDFWRCLMREESQRSEDWHRLMRKHHSVVERAEGLLEDMQDELDFRFRGRKRYTHWDPVGFGQSEERGVKCRRGQKKFGLESVEVSYRRSSYSIG